jgi:SAM-dependent methyltransferase
MIENIYGRSGNNRCGSSGAVCWKSGRAIQRHHDDLARSSWRSLGVIQESGGAGAGDIRGTRFANKHERALSSRVAGRHGHGRLSELRRGRKALQSSSRTCFSPCAGERPVFCRRHVGCGRGRGLIKLAQAFPRSRYVGYDNFGPTVARATANAREAGVSDRVRFEERDVSKGLPAQFDVITTFDVVHDAVDPLQLLQSIRRALRPGGVYVCLDINCSDKLEENANPLGAMFHGVSVFYCMTTSLANNGAGLGTLGFHEAKVRELCEKAGFSSVRRVPLENPFNNLYEAKP